MAGSEKGNMNIQDGETFSTENPENALEPETEEAITDKDANQIESLLEANKVDIESANFFVVYDKDGPLEDPSVSTAETWNGVEETVGSLPEHEDVEYAVVSGWPIAILEERKEDYLNPQFHLGGSMGTVVEIEDEKRQVSDLSKDAIYELFRNLYDEAADNGLKILPQPNFSNTVASIKFEAEGKKRANVGQISDDMETAEIYSQLKLEDPTAEFFYQIEGGDEKIVFENSRREVEALTETLTQRFNYPGIRFERTEDGRIAMYRDEEDNSHFSKKEGYNILEEAASEQFQVKPYDDWGSDLIRDTDVKIGKHQAVDELRDYLFRSNLTFMIGDSTTDMQVATELDDIYFVAIEDTEAEQAAEEYSEWEEGEDYLVMEEGVEFTESFSDLMNEYKASWNHEYQKQLPAA